MIHPNEPQDAPDWTCTPARCRCGAPEWEPDCRHNSIPPNVTLGEE